uniref:Uncharacterized protein n=1 Tax=Marseillevirus LCMAC103 TaxID=2506604 RepID=A0A481YUL0_9VIRU|nr:MAG: hypothetical protein LCMAC103_01110 [Marseillevirus LCMAC103]
MKNRPGEIYAIVLPEQVQPGMSFRFVLVAAGDGSVVFAACAGEYFFGSVSCAGAVFSVRAAARIGFGPHAFVGDAVEFRGVEFPGVDASIWWVTGRSIESDGIVAVSGQNNILN